MNYSESMSKRQQRRKALNQRFRRMFLVALLMGLAMGFVFGRCSAVNSKAPDVPIEPDQLSQAVKTPPFHGGNAGSIPARATMLPCWTWLKMLAGPSALMGKSYLLKWME